MVRGQVEGKWMTNSNQLLTRLALDLTCLNVICLVMAQVDPEARVCQMLCGALDRASTSFFDVNKENRPLALVARLTARR